MHTPKESVPNTNVSPAQLAPGEGAFQFMDSRDVNSKLIQLQTKANDIGMASKVAQLQKMASGNQVIQRKIHYKSGVFSGDSSRPGWRKALKEFVVDEYKEAHPSSSIDYSTNLTTLNVDRCHRVAFHVIQGWLLAYLNGTMTKASFTEKTNTLYRSDSPDLDTMKAGRTALYSATTNPKKLANARNLLSILNSATGNVRIGSDVVNRSIQDQLDGHYPKKGSKYSASPQTRKMLTVLDKGDAGSIPFSPGGTSVKTSDQSTTIPFGNFSPKTKGLLNKHK